METYETMDGSFWKRESTRATRVEVRWHLAQRNAIENKESFKIIML